MHSITPDFEHILICTSKPETTLQTGRHLSGTGTKLVASTSAEEARNYLASETVTAVIIDLLLVDCDGISFAQELRAQMPWLPIIVMTSENTSGQNTNYSQAHHYSMNTDEKTRLQFALKQASINNGTNKLDILHVENDDETAELIRGTLGRYTGLFRARSILEAKIALSVRSYDFALISTNHPLFYSSSETDIQGAHKQTNSLLSIVGQLRPPATEHCAGYC